MAPNTILMLIGAIVLFVWWQLYSLRNKVFVSYIRPSGQEIVKWVKLDDNKVRFDNLEFTIVPASHKLRWYRLMWGLLGDIGTWVVAYEFSHDSAYPRLHTPTNTVITPAVRRAINNQDSMKDYNSSIDKQSGRKAGLAQYFPFIVIGLLVFVAGYYLYGLISANNMQLHALSEQIRLMNK